MADVFHKDLYPNQGHVIHTWEYPTYQDMINDTKIFAATDVGKLALISSTGEYYILKQHIPPQWISIAQGSLSAFVYLTNVEVTNVVYNADNNPTQVDYANGWQGIVTYINNPDGTLTIDVKFFNDQTQLVEEWEYQYDTNKNLTSSKRLV